MINQKYASHTMWHPDALISKKQSELLIGLCTWWLIVWLSDVSSAIPLIELEESLEKDIFAVHNVWLHFVFMC